MPKQPGPPVAGMLEKKATQGPAVAIGMLERANLRGMNPIAVEHFDHRRKVELCGQRHVPFADGPADIIRNEITQRVEP